MPIFQRQRGYGGTIHMGMFVTRMMILLLVFFVVGVQSTTPSDVIDLVVPTTTTTTTTTTATIATTNDATEGDEVEESTLSPQLEETVTTSTIIPTELLGSFGVYPNLLNLTDEDRQTFHPVVKYSKQRGRKGGKKKDPTTTTSSSMDIPVIDCRQAKGLASMELITASKEKAERRRRYWWQRKILLPIQSFLQQPQHDMKGFHFRILRQLFRLKNTGMMSQDSSSSSSSSSNYYNNYYYGIGRYDENRISMYVSEHFQNLENEIDGYSGLRTIHLGIDLAAPVGTNIYAFTDGIVHSVGYNPEYGDYGYVVVIEHMLPSGIPIWALYGHLDDSIVLHKTNFIGKQTQVGKKIRKGTIIGRMGDCHENGGWELPHVHFQISLSPPETHDMPGASSLDDRNKALLQYPDPRLILGPIY